MRSEGDRAAAEPVDVLRPICWLVAVAALAGVAGYGFHRVFALADLAPVISVAAVVPVLLSAVLSWPRRRPWPLWISVVATVAGWVLVAGFTLFGGDFAVIGGALRDAWKGTLTTLLPAPGRPELLVMPHVLTWLAGVAGAEIVLRTRTKAAAALPALGVFVVALLVGVGGSGSNLPVVGALVGLAAVLTILRGQGRSVWMLTWAPAAMALGVAAAAVGPYLPVSGDPYDPREAVKAPPPQQRDSVNPLDRVSAWLQSPDQQMFSVRSTSPENWRLAVLDRFDGLTWTSGAQFVPAGTRVPNDGRHGRVRVQQHFRIQNLPGVWVPAADRPREIRGLGVTVDPRSGVLTAAQPLRPGQEYTVNSLVRDYDVDALAAAEPARNAAARAAVALPEAPGTAPAGAQVPKFRKLAQDVTRDESSAFRRAARLADWLRGYAQYDVTGLSGHSYAQLLYFLFRSRRGTPEQFATSYAVMARSLGLPVRVVVGFRPGIGGNGSWQVRSGDVLVWPEVAFSGLGWVPFFPTPDQGHRSKRPNDVPAGKTQQKLEAAQKNAAKRQAKGSNTNDQRPHRPPVKPGPHDKPIPWWVFVAAGSAALPLLYLLAVFVIPALRRYRRRNGATPAQQITGAWRQTVESLRGIGLPPSTTLTAHEVAGFGSRRMAGAEAHLRPLADLVNRAEYSAGDPGPSSALAAWRHTDAVDRLVAQQAGPMRRIVRRLHPRSLRIR